MEAYDPTTGKTFPSWDALVASESNGFAVAVHMKRGKRCFVRTTGPFDTRKDATAQATRIRRELKKHSDIKEFNVFVEPLWKDSILAAGFSRAAVPDAATEAERDAKTEVARLNAALTKAEQVCAELVGRARHHDIARTEAEAERDAALAAIERVRAIHVRHKDTHKRDPSVINGNWFCCGAVQLGAVDPYACIACYSPEWPCPTVAALDEHQNEGEIK